MSRFENMLRKAIELQNATDEQSRRIIYQKAQESINKLPDVDRSLLSQKIMIAVNKIESEYRQDFSDIAGLIETPNHRNNYPPNLKAKPTIFNSISNSSFQEKFLSKQHNWVLHAISFFRKRLRFKYITAFLTLVLICAVLAYFFNDTSSMQDSFTQEVSLRKSETTFTSIQNYKFPDDIENLIIQIPENSKAHESNFMGGESILVTSNVNFITKEFVKIDGLVSYVFELKFKLITDDIVTEQLPILHAGFLNFDENKEMMHGGNRFKNAAHGGRLKFDKLTSNSGGIFSVYGIVLDSSNPIKEHFPNDAKFFKIYVGIKMAGSIIPFELHSIKISTFN